MWISVAVAAAAFATKAANDLYKDAKIREVEYETPLKLMKENAIQLIESMVAEAAKDKNLSPDQFLKIKKDIYSMVSEGAVAQRNYEMEQTRKKISMIGYYLSWFMKQKGLSLAAIQAKYEKEFSEDEKKGHLKIIESASRPNSDLVSKFYCSILKRLGLNNDRNSIVAHSKL